VLVAVNVLSKLHSYKRGVTALGATRRKRLAIHTGNLMFLLMLRIMQNTVDARMLALVTRFV
jgi:hypothetical protein